MDAFVIPVGLFLVLIFITFALKSAYVKGKYGEWLVSRYLLNQLNSSEYQILNNVTLSFQGKTTQIDHIVVSKYGIFVIETKHFSGLLFGSPYQPNWKQVLYKKKYKIINPLRQNFGHCKVIGQTLGLDDKHVHSIVVITGEGRFKENPPKNVFYGSSFISHIQSFFSPIFSEEEVTEIVGLINEYRLEDCVSTDIAHIKQVRLSQKSR